MDTPSIDSPPVSALDAIAAIDPNAIVDAPLLELTFLGNTSSIVDFSPLATFLAATLLAQTRLTPQTQPAPANTNANTTTTFQQIATAATNFVNAFNTFQSSVDALTNPLSAAFEEALLREIQGKNTPQTAENTQSFINSLSSLGINFQEATNPTNPNQFQIDWNRLETAYQANPTQTATLLANSFQAFNAIEENLMLSQSTLGAANAVDIIAAQAATTGTAAANPTATTPVAAPAATTTLSTILANVSTTTATAPAVTITTVGPTAAATNASAIPSAAVQATTIDPLVATAVAAYRAGEVLANPPGDKMVQNPITANNPEVTQVYKINPDNSNANGSTAKDAQNPAYTVPHVHKVEPNVAVPFTPGSNGVDVSV